MEYEKCLVEVDEVLNHLSKEELNKIPEDVLKGIKKRKDKEYMWKYDESKRLEEQRFDRNTIVILSYINMEYLLSKEQKDLMEKLHELNEQNFAKEIQEKFDSKEDISSMTEFFKYEMEKTWEKTLDKAKLENNTRNSKLHDYLDDKDIADGLDDIDI